jgi:hypothetical protein
MSIDKSELLGFLAEIDRELDRRIVLVAVGGTAMTVLGVKPSTIDVDFTLSGDDYDVFKRVLVTVPHGFTVHCFRGGVIFSQILPEDYLTRSSIVKTTTKNIELRALNPVDIVVTKVGRLDGRDKEDIQRCIEKFSLSKNHVAERGKQVEYVGRQENYEINLKHVLDNFFK